MKVGFSTLSGYIKRGLKKMAPYYQSFHCQNNWGLEHAKADSTIKKGEVNLRFSQLPLFYQKWKGNVNKRSKLLIEWIY